MALSAFSPELILKIAWYLQQRDCLNFVCCSRYLCHVVRHSLFRAVRLNWRATPNSLINEANSHFVRFVRIIVEEPSVARSVTEMVAFEGHSNWDRVGREMEAATNAMTQSEIEDCLKAVKAAHLGEESDGEALVADLRSLIHAAVQVGIPPRVVLTGGFAGLLALLFYHLPNLTDLHLSLVCPSYPFFSRTIEGRLTPNVRLPQALISFRKLVFDRTHLFSGTSWCVCWEPALPFFKLPSLQRVELGNFSEATPLHEIPHYLNHHTKVLSDHRSPITSLLLRKCRFSPHIFRLISSVSPLTSLRVSSPTDCLKEGETFSSLISAQTESLGLLHMPNWNANANHSDSLGTLLSFTSLTEFHVEYQLLQIQLDGYNTAGFPIHRVLPPSLARLKIFLGRHSRWGLRAFINKTQMPGTWSQEKRYFPSLESFRIKRGSPNERHGPDLAEALEGFKAMGIEVSHD